MAEGVLIVGPSGSGKSTSIRNLDPKSTFIINVAGKPLPFKNTGFTKCEPNKPPKEGNIYNTDNPNMIFKAIQFVAENRPEIEKIIVDDTQYLAANEFMRRIDEKSFQKFNDIGKNFWNLGNSLPSLRENLIVYYLMHEDTEIDAFGNKKRKAKTIGKLVDNVITLEGMFSMVLWCEARKNGNKIEHVFITNNDGSTTAKTPMGMFEEETIENDLAIVDHRIREFYQ